MDDKQAQKFTDEANKLTHSPIIQKFDHVQRFPNVWNLFLETSSPLRKVSIHVPVLSTRANDGSDDEAIR